MVPVMDVFLRPHYDAGGGLHVGAVLGRDVGMTVGPTMAYFWYQPMALGTAQENLPNTGETWAQTRKI